MGLLSRKLFPVCESMCICCPALRSRSRQPVKRYKKLLAEIFPKSLDDPPNDRKIVKLCEYAAKNPFRIPKIAAYLEERFYKELRCEHIKYINIIVEAFNKLLCICKEQMAYFAISLLNVVNELLDKSKQDALLILGCQTLTRYIYSQADGTYSHSIEKLAHKICRLAREDGDEHGNCLKAYSLQCLSAMVWFMAEISYIFYAFDEIVHVTLDNYEPDMHKCDNEKGESHWVDEVVRYEGKGTSMGDCPNTGCLIVRPRPEKKDPSRLLREEIETPRVWAQICIQRMIELAKESTTMCLVLDSMFSYFDCGLHWKLQHGLAIIVLSNMSYLLEGSGHQQLILSSVIRHLDHKNVAHDPQLKSYVIQVATALARQFRSGAVLAEIGFVGDLCRHLRKSLQATDESAGEHESHVDITLQKTIEDCLLEIAKGVSDARLLYDTMAITLEKVPSYGVVARATIGSLLILAHTISLSLTSFHSQQVFPEGLLLQLLKVMLHPDIEVRIGAHKIFSAIGIRCCNHLQHGATLSVSDYYCEVGRLCSNASSAATSVSTLLDKLRRGKDNACLNKRGSRDLDGCKERDITEESKQGWARNNSPNCYKLSSIIDRTTGAADVAQEPCIMTFSEDQISQLLSAFWIQANLPDNMPSNFEAIAHSFSLVLISSGLKRSNDHLMVQFFQLPLSLRNSSIDNGMVPPACQRSIFVLSTVTLIFAAKIYQIPELNDLVSLLLPCEVDPFLSISDDFELQVKPQVDVREYGSASDSQQAMLLLPELRSKRCESDKVLMHRLLLNLSTVIELDIDELSRTLSEPFTPDEAFLFVPQSMHGVPNQTVSQSHDSLSFDDDIRTSSLVEDDATSEALVVDQSRFIPRIPSSPTVSHIISIGKLLESALEVAGQVAGTSVSTSPLPYDAMAKQCEAFGMGTRKKLTNWLVQENNGRVVEKLLIESPSNGNSVPWKVAVRPADPCMSVRLPPASPFDYFLKAAGS